MSEYKEKIVDLLTGEITYRNYTDAEIAEVEVAQAKAEAAKAETEAKQAARQALLAKLGITEDEAKLLLS